MATQGYIPVVAIYSTFLQRAFDQIIHDVCTQNLPVVFAIDRGGIVGDDGKTHQGTFDISYLSLIPQLIVASPKDENELQHLLYTAVKSGRPMAVRYPRSAGLGVPLDTILNEIPIGKGEILRYGNDVAVLALGASVHYAYEAARLLSLKGIESTLINARFAKPLDEALIINMAQRFKNIVTVEENVLTGGFGSSVNRLLQESGITGVSVKSIGIADEFVEHGTQAILRAKYGLDAEGIAKKIMEILTKPGTHLPVDLEHKAKT
jgi:1-deoxy-D-xylulose-5-phosphate synthase